MPDKIKSIKYLFKDLKLYEVKEKKKDHKRSVAGKPKGLEPVVDRLNLSFDLSVKT